MQAYQALWILQRSGEFFQRDGGRVGGQHRARLQFWLQTAQERLFGIKSFHDHLDDNVCLRHHVAIEVGAQSVQRCLDGSRVETLLAEKSFGPFDRRFNKFHFAVLQTDL